MAPKDGCTVVESATSLRGWADLVNERFVPLHVTASDADHLAGSVTTREVGHLQVSEVVSIPQRFHRPKSLLHEGADVVAIGRVTRGTGILEQDGRICEVSDGAFALYDTARPFSWTLHGEWAMQVYLWPRHSLGVDDTRIGGLTAVPVSTGAGVGRLIAPVLGGLAADLSPSPPPRLATRLADELADLAVTAILEADGHTAAGVDTEDVLRRVLRHIEENLTDPAMTPETIAEEFYISVRTLHRLFAREGLTIAAWIKMRRLEAARRVLGGPAASRMTISEVAERHGFTNAAFFSREFAARYGVSPRDYRASMA